MKGMGDVDHDEGTEGKGHEKEEKEFTRFKENRESEIQILWWGPKLKTIISNFREKKNKEKLQETKPNFNYFIRIKTKILLFYNFKGWKLKKEKEIYIESKTKSILLLIIK